MLIIYSLATLYCMVPISVVASFAPDLSSFDAYGLKLAGNDYLLVESIPSESAFLLRLAPYNYVLSCTLPYNNSDDYVYAVAVAWQPTANDSIRFVFIGVNTDTEVSFIGSLTYTGVGGPAYIANMTAGRKSGFPCGGWQTNNYRIHVFNEFSTAENPAQRMNDFFVVAIEYVLILVPFWTEVQKDSPSLPTNGSYTRSL